MAALLFYTFAIVILISFLLGLILAHPFGGLLSVGILMIVGFIHDYRKGVL